MIFTYTHIQNYFYKKFVDEDVLSHRFDSNVLLPLIPASSLKSEDSQRQPIDILNQLEESDMPVFDLALRQQWQIIKNVMKHQKDVDWVRAAAQFFQAEYLLIMKSIIDQRSAP